MRVQISKWGNSTALRLPQEAARDLGLKPGDVAELVVEGGEARLKKVIEKSRKLTLQDMVDEMKRLGKDCEPPMVDWGPDVGEEIVKD